MTLQINELEGGVDTSANEAERAFVSPEGEPKTTKAGLPGGRP